MTKRVAASIASHAPKDSANMADPCATMASSNSTQTSFALITYAQVTAEQQATAAAEQQEVMDAAATLASMLTNSY